MGGKITFRDSQILKGSHLILFHLDEELFFISTFNLILFCLFFVVNVALLLVDSGVITLRSNVGFDVVLLLLFSARTVSEEWSSSGDSKTEDEERERRSPREKDGRDKDKEDCKSLGF